MAEWGGLLNPTEMLTCTLTKLICTMDTLVQKLIDAFQLKGWQCIAPADASSDWWFTDIFQLRSVRRPDDANIYLTLLSDPQLVEQKIIWCVGVSSNLVRGPIKYLASLAVNDIKQTDLGAFVEKIDKAILTQHEA